MQIILTYLLGIIIISDIMNKPSDWQIIYLPRFDLFKLGNIWDFVCV